MDDEDLREIVDTYFKVVTAEKREVNHFIGTVVRTLNKELSDPLVKEFEIRQASEKAKGE